MKTKCLRCGGTGIIGEQVKSFFSGNTQYYDYLVKQCPKCDGKKELDWIEQITGIKEKGPVFRLSGVG
jgi:hypothetical protein